MKIVIIAALASKGVIGSDVQVCPTCDGESAHQGICPLCRGTVYVPCNELPWPEDAYPEYTTHLDTMTRGHATAVGRKTLELYNKRPLGAMNILVSKTPSLNHKGTWRMPSLEDAVKFAADYHDTLYVVGGATLFRAALPLADELDLTLIDREYDGNLLFPGTWEWEVQAPSGLRGGVVVGKDRRPWYCIERRPGINPDITFTRWTRR